MMVSMTELKAEIGIGSENDRTHTGADVSIQG